jgi:hypothetical protein
MHVRDDEEEFSLSQPVTASVLLSLHRLVLEEEFLLRPPVAVPPEEVEVPVVQGPSVMVPPEEEEFLAPAVPVSQGPLSRSRQRKRRSQLPPMSWYRRKEEDALSLYWPW